MLNRKFVEDNTLLMPESFDFDAIVIGSGISGGWAAKELCERGLKTIVLDIKMFVVFPNRILSGLYGVYFLFFLGKAVPVWKFPGVFVCCWIVLDVFHHGTPFKDNGF